MSNYAADRWLNCVISHIFGVWLHLTKVEQLSSLLKTQLKNWNLLLWFENAHIKSRFKYFFFRTAECSECKATFKNKNALFKHKQTEHGMEEGGMKTCCDICGLFLSTAGALAQHKEGSDIYIHINVVYLGLFILYVTFSHVRYDITILDSWLIRWIRLKIT